MTTTKTAPPPSGIDPLLTDKQLAAALNLSVKTVKRQRQRGHMPPAVRVSLRKLGTRQSLFEQWLRDREKATK
jgi:predicted DNA-binding transcriptional regulator AlpA